MKNEEREKKMFGCTIEGMTATRDEYVGEGKTWRTTKELAFSILSDAQELISLGHSDQANVAINRAKWFLGQ